VLGAGCAISENLAAAGGGTRMFAGGEATGGLWSDGTLVMTEACRQAVSGNAAGAGRNGTSLTPGLARSDPDLRGTVGNVFELTVGTAGTGSGSVGASTPPAPLAGTIDGCGSAGGACAATYAGITPAAMVTLTATPAPGSTFDGWGGACAGATGTTCDVTMDQSRAVSARFGLLTHAVSPQVNGSGTLTCISLSVTHGGTTTCEATPDPGHAVQSIGGCFGTATGPGVNLYTTGPVTESCTVSAVFAPIPTGPTATITAVPTLGTGSLTLLGLLTAGLAGCMLRRKAA
jgi:hypothetical protein